MAVVIQNIAFLEDDHTGGLCRYRVCINYLTMAVFEHRRSDGMAVCLEKAAVAVREAEERLNRASKKPVGKDR